MYVCMSVDSACSVVCVRNVENQRRDAHIGLLRVRPTYTLPRLQRCECPRHSSQKHEARQTARSPRHDTPTAHHHATVKRRASTLHTHTHPRVRLRGRAISWEPCSPQSKHSGTLAAALRAQSPATRIRIPNVPLRRVPCRLLGRLIHIKLIVRAHYPPWVLA